MKREIIQLLETMSIENMKIFIQRQSHEQMDYLQMALEYTSNATQDKWNSVIQKTMSLTS
ncbi:hypothetical protein CN918_26130 [Priestia megaterium]|nr:hypothetical protein CN918_26130 [Priestia megaterium]